MLEMRFKGAYLRYTLELKYIFSRFFFIKLYLQLLRNKMEDAKILNIFLHILMLVNSLYGFVLHFNDEIPESNYCVQLEKYAIYNLIFYIQQSWVWSSHILLNQSILF